MYSILFIKGLYVKGFKELFLFTVLRFDQFSKGKKAKKEGVDWVVLLKYRYDF